MLEIEKKESKTREYFSENTRVDQPEPSVQSEQAGLEQQRKCLEETTKNELASQGDIPDIRKYWYHT